MYTVYTVYLSVVTCAVPQLYVADPMLWYTCRKQMRRPPSTLRSRSVYYELAFSQTIWRVHCIC